MSRSHRRTQSAGGGGPAGPLAAQLVALAERLEGFDEPPLLSQREAQGIVGPGEVVLEADGLAQGRLRLLVPALKAQGNAEVVVRLGEVVPEADGLAQGHLRLLVLALAPHGVTEAAVRVGAVGLRADGLLDGCLRLRGLALPRPAH